MSGEVPRAMPSHNLLIAVTRHKIETSSEGFTQYDFFNERYVTVSILRESSINIKVNLYIKYLCKYWPLSHIFVDLILSRL